MNNNIKNAKHTKKLILSKNENKKITLFEVHRKE
jgi:hypothetical protein